MADTCTSLAHHLTDLLAQLTANNNNPEETWQHVELTAQNLANRLRVKDNPGWYQLSSVFIHPFL